MKVRYTAALKYLQALEKSLKKGWRLSYQGERDTVYSKVALLHPYHLKDIDLPEHLTIESIQHSVQGARKFGPKVGNSTCQSSMLWGYECKLGGDIQQDHLFPYSLGGPSLGTNRIYLCHYHNMVKGSDIHCFPWESTEMWIEPWLDSMIEKLRVEVHDLYAR